MERQLIKLILASIVIVTFFYGAALLYCCGVINLRYPYCASFDSFGVFYGKNLRGSLFAGFLTLGGFLLSLKTFIVINMKKEVFDTVQYQNEWKEQKKLDSSNDLGLMYSPLRELSSILFASILSCVVTAVLQLTLGLTETLIAAIICLWSALVSLLLLTWSLWLIRTNLTRMFDYLDNSEPK
jgi:hypothetical protein